MNEQDPPRKKERTATTPNSSCARNFMLSEIMKDHPIYARYADFYLNVAMQEISELRKKGKHEQHRYREKDGRSTS